MDTNNVKKETFDDKETAKMTRGSTNMVYSVEETPPWYLCLLLGFQHYLTAFGSIIAVPIVLREYFCLDEDTVGLGELIGTIFFVSGIATLLQTTFGVRLPIVQGGTLSFIAPAVAIMLQPQWQCPYTEARKANESIVNFTAIGLPDIGSDGHREIWMSRIREIQGAVMVASLFQIVVGFSGLLGIILKFVGPLAVAPTITLIGMSLFSAAANKAAQQWWIALVTMFLVTLFSQFLGKIKIPCMTGMDGRKCKTTKLPVFDLFPILLAMVITWIICAILTATEVLPNIPGKWGYNARTDTKNYVLQQSEWFRFPYPGQWGAPTVSVASVFGMMAGVIASMIESVGDYYACARLSGAPPPPTHAINRGIGIEGIGCLLAGAIGTGNGTTSYSHNIGVIGLTKVGSRRVVQVGGVIMILLGCLGKIGGLFSTIPDPVIGGMFMITFGMITSVGLSNLQYVDLNSSRNLFILGVSLFFGFSMPNWMSANRDVIQTGNDVVDQILTVLLSTSMFVGGALGLILDNAIPGTEEERGIKKWRTALSEDGDNNGRSDMHIYDFPLIQRCFDKVRIFEYIPFCPTFMRPRSTETLEVYVDEEKEKSKSREADLTYVADNIAMTTNDEQFNTKF
ncbi:solute carrier family 23 member 1-like [Mercenaria mercenaria]|uniref:solute carrier family 23 member 1-like n=1 Tax=Mercenaria mercenaria TaxID=6596 RepID=UPI00234EE970|nr:solute carrier family 23 member 1-like [Mercenaria mercenaria]